MKSKPTLEELCKPLNVDLTVEEKASERDELIEKVETLEESIQGLEGDKANAESEYNELHERLRDFQDWARTEIIPQIESGVLTTTSMYDELMNELKSAIRG